MLKPLLAFRELIRMVLAFVSICVFHSFVSFLFKMSLCFNISHVRNGKSGVGQTQEFLLEIHKLFNVQYSLAPNRDGCRSWHF